MSTDDLLELVDRLGGHHELVLQESVGPVGAVPLSDHVERVIELRQILDLAAVASAHSVPQLAIGPKVNLLARPLGKMSGSREAIVAHRISAGPSAASSGSWSSVASEPREIDGAARASAAG